MVFYKVFLKNFCKIHRETPRPEACNFIKKETLAHVFPCEFREIFQNTLFTGHLRTTASGVSEKSDICDHLEAVKGNLTN